MGDILTATREGREGSRPHAYDAVAIVKQVRILLPVPDRLAEVLPRPLGGRMHRHVKVNQSTAVMFDDDETYKTRNVLVTATQKSHAMNGPCMMAKES